MDMLNHTLIVLAWELHKQGVPKAKIAQHLGKHRETIILWIQGIERSGLLEFLDKYEKAKKGPREKRQVDPLLKRRVWNIREREMDCCGQKIRYFLKREYGVCLSAPKIYEILAEKYEIRSRWKKNQERGPIPRASQPREVVQMDTLDFGEIYAFTGIDIFSKEADVLIAPELTARFGSHFLEQSMERRFNHYVHLIQTDGGSEFKDEFKNQVNHYCDRYRIARPYRKNEQAFIESFNRTLRKECLGWIKYRVGQLTECQNMVESFLERYHYHRPHMGLGMKTPLIKQADLEE
ncbi:transposase [Candidatus Shapirobacteria bacterium]|nr:transposase [Candidatus Shapirobacteria bacterium]